MTLHRPLLTATLLCTLAATAHAQRAPEIGYMYPAGGKAGATVDVVLGGYNWTPDMELFATDAGVKVEPSGAMGPVLVPPPPYWFGAKGRLTGPPLPRETPAKLTLPANLAPGLHTWYAANANGGSSPAVFLVSSGDEVLEDEDRKAPQAVKVPGLVWGRVLKNEDVDRFKFTAEKDGPVTCEIFARRLGSKFLPVVDVRDGQGTLIADSVGSHSADPIVTFFAKAKTEYTIGVRDVDFAGDRSFVYRLSLTPGPRIVSAIPAAGKAGETREVEFLVDAGNKRETIKKPVAFPAKVPEKGSSVDVKVDTPLGPAHPFTLLVSPSPQTVRADKLDGSGGVTGVLEEADGEKKHTVQWKKGDVWSIEASARKIGSPLDLAVVILGPKGKEMDKELARNEDQPNTTDAGLEFPVPEDGTYHIVVSNTGGRAASGVYHLEATKVEPDFHLKLSAPKLSVTIGAKPVDLPVKAVRKGGFKGPIALTITGLPAGITAPAELVIAADKNDLNVPLTIAADAGSSTALVTVEGTSKVGDKDVKRVAIAPSTARLVVRDPDENDVEKILVTAAMKQRFKGHPVDADTGRKVPRGSTHPADIVIERLDGWDGEIVMMMAAAQSYQSQGITGHEVPVPPGATKAIYPCYMPEWLETTRTSRMGIVGVAKVADPKGKVRHLMSDIKGFVTMTMEGALMRIETDAEEMISKEGQPIDVPIKLSRTTELPVPAKIEVIVPKDLYGKLKADVMTLEAGKTAATVRVTPNAGITGPITFSIRATALKDGKYPAVSEAPVTVEITPAMSSRP